MMVARALDIARQHGLDLVEVAPTANPPVCRIMDFSKYKYEQEKKERKARKNQKQTHLKQIRIKPNIDDHDLQIKVKRAKAFLEKKDKVKVNLFFRGREMAHVDRGREVLNRFIELLGDEVQIERPAAMEGRVMSIMLAPLSSKKTARPKPAVAAAPGNDAEQKSEGPDTPAE